MAKKRELAGFVRRAGRVAAFVLTDGTRETLDEEPPIKETG